MTKLRAIWTLLRNEHFLVITPKGYHATTPKFGHSRFWREALECFNRMRDYADKQQSN